jgi:hypothetical protein
VDNAAVQLFHYHLVTSELRDVEARYIGKLGFDLVARYGRIGEEHVTAEQGASWEQLDRDGFRLRLTELQRGAVNVVIQPGHWRLPRIDHFGVVLDEDDFQGALMRATQWNLPVQERGSRRTFISTNAGYRIEIHPPRDWIDELLERSSDFMLDEIQVKVDRPEQKAGVLADVLDVPLLAASVEIGETLVRFLPGGPEGRPELYAERFV